MSIKTLQSLLSHAASAEDQSQKIITYPAGSDTAETLSYAELLKRASENAASIRKLSTFRARKVVVIHVDTHLDNIVWFWSVLLAGGLPNMSLPVSRIEYQRIAHIKHLETLLEKPIWITHRGLKEQLAGVELDLHMLEDFKAEHEAISEIEQPESGNAAFLMLTSGSTGESKAVVLTHDHVLTAIKGKIKAWEEPRSWLNWIGFDHVAAFEAHLTALYLQGQQVHILASDVIANPLRYLGLIERHQIVASFAPNFFLSKLNQVLQNSEAKFDLASFKVLVSGGEANDASLCVALGSMLQKFGAGKDLVVPAFGMTETFAGSISNVKLIDSGEAASLGKSHSNVEVRVRRGNTQNEPGIIGSVELRGDGIFKEYYNNPIATAEAFVDGWFKTGDQGYLDQDGLHLTGRFNEVININGVKYAPQEIESVLEAAGISGLTPGHTVAFGYREEGAATEQVAVVFLPTYKDPESAVETTNAVIKNVLLQIGARPYVLPLDDQVLKKTSLGKISRAKIRAAWVAGSFEQHKKRHEELIKKNVVVTAPSTDVEAIILDEVCVTLGIDKANCGVDSPFFELGISSLETLALKVRLEQRLNRKVDTAVLLQSPTVRSLAEALAKDREYSPLVVLQAKGKGNPLWLIHPGVGDVLVFLDLARRSDRPVYALRARGFGTGDCFRSIEEVTTTYRDTIKKQQPEGPYAMAGYCYGAMIAFETAKLLEADGNEVRFLASIDLPPHIAWRMRQLDWQACLTHLAFFTGLIDEEYSEEILPELRTLSREAALDSVIGKADAARWKELALTKDDLFNWVDVAYELHVIAWDYEPKGSVESIDVFYAEPLRIVAQTKKDWAAGPLMDWQEFSREELKLHDCPGGHYTMIGVDYIKPFQVIFEKAMKEKGL